MSFGSRVGFARARLKQAVQDWFLPYGHSGASYLLRLPRSNYDYAADVGDGLGSSVVTPVVQWLMRAFPEAKLTVKQRKGDESEVVPDHPLIQRVMRPNDFYGSAQLWMATVFDWCWFGESFWRMDITRGDRVKYIWWVPPWCMEPIMPQDGSAFLSYYRYTTSTGKIENLPREKVIHFRHGLDPRNPLRGLPPLRAILREIWMDDEASNWVAAILRNMGIPGLLITPKGEASIGPDDAAMVKSYVEERFTGDQRGKPMVLSGPTDVEQLSFTPQQMDLSVVRDVAEERVCSALGIPAAVVGLGTGQQQTKVGATMTELRQLAWANGLIPVQAIMAEELTRVLLPHFERDPDRFELAWDYRTVQALQEDENRKWERITGGLRAGLIRRDQAKRLVGLDPEPGDEVYLLPLNILETPQRSPEEQRRALQPVASRNGDGNGNGNGHARARHNGDDGDEEEDEEEDDKGFHPYDLKQGTLAELVTSLIGRHAPHVQRIPRVLIRLVAHLERQAPQLMLSMERDVSDALDRIADLAEGAARDILEPKQMPDDVIDAARIADGIQLLAVRGLLERVFERSYERIAVESFSAMGQLLGLETDIPDVVMRAVLATGGRRAGLIDLERQIRETLFEAITEGRAAGEGVDQLVRRIRDWVPAGPWRTPAVRARVIARTETRFAQSTSSILRARDAGIQHMMIFDARLSGPTDAECQALNGVIVTVQEAELLASTEHPNGTRQAVPVPAVLLEEMQGTGRLVAP